MKLLENLPGGIPRLSKLKKTKNKETNKQTNKQTNHFFVRSTISQHNQVLSLQTF